MDLPEVTGPIGDLGGDSGPLGPGPCRILDMDFREPRKGEVPRTPLLGTCVNKVAASLPAHPSHPSGGATTERREKAAWFPRPHPPVRRLPGLGRFRL